MTEIETTTKGIAAYSKVEAVLATLRDSYENVIFDCTTREGMAQAKSARGEIRGWRTGLDKDRVKEKAEALAHGKWVDAEANRIKEQLVALEGPIADQIDEVVQREKREEEAKEKARVDRIAEAQGRIDAIKRAPVDLLGESGDVIANVLKNMEAMVIDKGFAELEEVARGAHSAAIIVLGDMHAAAVLVEEERVELDRLKAEQVKRDADNAAADKERKEAEEASRKKIEEQERESRERIEKTEKKAREKQEAEEAIAKAEREKKEAEEREARKAEEDIADAFDMLRLFLERHGDKEGFAEICLAIHRFLVQEDAA